jgi:hypothetical protein
MHVDRDEDKGVAEYVDPPSPALYSFIAGCS